MSKTILRLTGITKQFPGTRALSDVDFELREGEVHALVGPNGSGKSTLMNILAGVFRPTSGRISLYDEEVSFHNPRDAMQKGIVMIHQELRLFPKLSVAENICFGQFPMNKAKIIDWPAMERFAEKYVRMLSDEIDVKAIVETLSVAEQQIVEIAKALSRNARILIMDEPTASLTLKETQALFSTIRNLKSRGITVVFISHRMNEILEISDRITVLRDSLLIDTLENSSELEKSDIVKLMINRDVNVDLTKEGRDLTGAEVALSVQNLAYGNRLHGISFEAHKGEVLGIAGLIGAGRTELFHCIFGDYTGWSGTMEVNGKPYRPRSPKDAVQEGIAYISEDRKDDGLILSMSIRDNMLFASFPTYMHGIMLNRRKIAEDTERVIADLRLKCASSNSLASELSGGNQQKVVIGKWLLANSDIILMDEPTRGIDVGAKDDVYKLAEALAAQGKCVIFVSSELEEVLRISDRILVMAEGRISAEAQNVNLSLEEIMNYATNERDAG